jgi:hypothetical protein
MMQEKAVGWHKCLMVGVRIRVWTVVLPDS